MKEIVLLGDSGIGKTATALQIIEDLKPDILIEGKCRENSAPYDLFYDMLDSFFDVDLFNRRRVNESVKSIIDLASDVLLGPIAGFMSGNNEFSVSKQDIYVTVKNKFLEFKKGIIFIDDIQWIDDASKELLKYILAELKNTDFLFIITSRSEEIPKDLGLNNFIKLNPLNKKEQIEFLKNFFSLADEVANWIVEKMNSDDNAYPINIVNIVSNLSRNNFIVKRGSVYKFGEKFKKDFVIIPDSIEDEIEYIFMKYPTYKEPLSLAAIIGKEFDVEILGEATNLNIIETTNLLYEISNKTGIIYDVLEKDKMFSFKSQLYVDAIKRIMKYTSNSFVNTKAPQIVRYYNQLIAEAMGRKKYSDIKIASYYYGAGKSAVEKSFEYQIKAAVSCKNMFEFDEAIRYIEKAKTLINFVNKKNELEYIELLVEAEREFVTGDIDLNFTDQLIDYLSRNNSDEIKIIAARAAYASGKLDKAYFSKCVEIAEKYLIPSSNKYTQAEGYHFAAISMDNIPENIEKKRKYFKESLKLSQDNKSLYSKIANSYAGFLSFGNNEDKLLAKTLFEESIKIKSSLPIKDLPGLARAYGGLGRLYLFSEPCECDKAIEYLNKDLNISLELKDKFGISNMYSLLGMAYRLKGDCETANKYYDKSLELEHNPIDVFASIFGKIACGSNELEKAKKYIEKYGNPPEFTFSFLDERIKHKLNLIQKNE